jgi:hypothetical protein
MGEIKKTPIFIDDVEYVFEDMTPIQQACFDQCVSLDRKIIEAYKLVDQLIMGKQGFHLKLKAEIENPTVLEQPVTQ